MVWIFNGQRYSVRRLPVVPECSHQWTRWDVPSGRYECLDCGATRRVRLLEKKAA